MELEKLQYPIGQFTTLTDFNSSNIKLWIAEIEALPQKLGRQLNDITEGELNTPYRPDGWTVRQVVHHIADSHSNAFIRTKLALTEVNPTIKPYDEAAWAMLLDYKLPIEQAMQIIAGIHYKWVALLKSLSDTDLDRTYFHPESKKTFAIKMVIGNYAWHSNHHLAHIKLVTGGL